MSELDWAIEAQIAARRADHDELSAALRVERGQFHWHELIDMVASLMNDADTSPAAWRGARPGFCGECGRWREERGHVTGWDEVSGWGFIELPLGDRPADYRVDEGKYRLRFRACSGRWPDR